MDVISAVDRDLDDLVRLNGEVQALHFEHNPERFRAPDPALIRPMFERWLKDADCRILVARRGETVVGYALLFVRDVAANALCHERRFVEIDQICVTSTGRRSGVGNELMAAAKRFASDQGITTLELSVWHFNETAQRFFERHGFALALERRTCRLSGR
jgi:diamine N-acetyltransferase